MMTPADLIRLALKTAGIEGIGQTPDAEDTNDVFTVLNAMIGQWNRKRWLIYNLIDIPCLSTGASSYSVGPTGDFNTPRPDRLESAYVRMMQGSGNVDFPLNIIEAHEDYASITMKHLISFPSMIFYDSSFPLGQVYVYPTPPASLYELHLILKNTITQFPNLTTQIILPPEYTDALIWNLAARIAPMFGVPPNPTVVSLATMALNVIRGANSQIPRLSMPAGIPNALGGRWAGHGIVNYGSTS